jgi:hypothetical protein
MINPFNELDRRWEKLVLVCLTYPYSQLFIYVFILGKYKYAGANNVHKKC